MANVHGYPTKLTPGKLLHSGTKDEKIHCKKAKKLLYCMLKYAT